MKEKYNFKINSSEKTVSVNVSLSVFPKPVILHAAYHFIDEAKVIVGEGKKNKILITFIPEKNPLKESDLEELAYEFNIQLIASFVENIESERHAKLREGMMKAALLPQGMPHRTQSMPPGTKENQKEKP